MASHSGRLARTARGDTALDRRRTGEEGQAMKFATLVSAIPIALSTVAHAQLQQPSASEVFASRNECVKLGKTILGKRLAETFGDERIGIGIHSLGTRYDPNTSHCYVQLIDVNEDNSSLCIQLLDGQTEQQLAYCRVVNGE